MPTMVLAMVIWLAAYGRRGVCWKSAMPDTPRSACPHAETLGWRRGGPVPSVLTTKTQRMAMGAAAGAPPPTTLLLRNL